MSKVFIPGATRPHIRQAFCNVPPPDSNVIKCAPAGLGTTTRKRLPLVREKAGFTHDMTIFHRDVRRKRFIMHERVAQRFPDRNF